MIVQAQRATVTAGHEQAAAVIAQIALLAVLDVNAAGWLAGTSYAVALWCILGYALWRAGIVSFGPADRVTLARASLVGGVVALVVTGAPALVLAAVAAVALLLDAVDGQVARRTGTVSALGARFDMEVDAFLILVLSVHVAFSAGPWVLAIGAMRYVFVAASWLLPWLKAPLPVSYARKTVAALQGVFLVLAGLLPGAFAAALAALALALLTWSFGRDVWWLHRNRCLA